MSTQIGYASSHTEKMWRAGLVLQSKRATNVMTLADSETSVANSAFPILEKPGNGRGDTVELTFTRPNEDEDPKTVNDESLGMESGSSYFKDSLALRYFKYDGAVQNFATEQQLVSFDRKASEVERIACQWGYLWEKVILNQLSGNTVVNSKADYGLSGGNIVTAMDAPHIFRDLGTGGHATDQAVAGDTTAILTTDVIDELVMRSVSRTYVKWPLAKCKTPLGLDLYVFWVDPEGFKQIKENSSASDLYDLERAMIQGGMDPSKSALINGEGFVYNSTLVLRTDFLPQGINSGTGAAEPLTRRCVFHGARSGHFLFGESFTDGNHLGYSEHMIHRRLSLIADSVYGFKRTIVDGESWGSFAVTHYTSV